MNKIVRSALLLSTLSMPLFASSLVPLGATVTHTNGNFQTTYAIWSPDTSNVQLWVEGENSNYTLSNTEQYISSDSNSTVYYITLPENDNLKAYHFIINGTPVHDPYARMTDLNWNNSNYQNNDVVMDLNEVNSEVALNSYTASSNQVSRTPYELSIRDYTINPNSGVDSELQGTFSGLVESQTNDEGYPTGFDHLKALGITDIQIMPMYQFATSSIAQLQSSANPNIINNWGYDPANFNVPEWRYSKYNTYNYGNGAHLPDPSNLEYMQRLEEVRGMMNKLHSANIGVIMDVVYNHTYSKNTLSNITSKYYLSYDLSGCGNTLNVSDPMVSQMVLDSMKYWVQEYGVDGFRFDVMGAFPYSVMKQWAASLKSSFPSKNLILYGEPWTANSDPHDSTDMRLGTLSMTENSVGTAQVGGFNPVFRDALGGDCVNPSAGGFIYNQMNSSNYTSAEPIIQGVLGATRYPSNETNPICTLSNEWDPQFAYEPGEDINYLSCHDNLTQWDKIKVWAYNNPNRNSGLPYLKRIDEFSAGILYTSQGVPFIQGGDEFLRSKTTSSSTHDISQGVTDNGNGSAYYAHNSYDLNDSVNRINWNFLSQNSDVSSYYTTMIALRNAHPAFRMNSWSAITKNISVTNPSTGVIVENINGSAVGDCWSKIIVILNAAPDYTYTLPSGSWNLAMSNGNPPTSATSSVSGSVLAAGTAVTILYQ